MGLINTVAQLKFIKNKLNTWWTSDQSVKT